MTDKTLSYKDYCGSIEFSIEDGCLYGKLLFINDLVTYEGNTLPELISAFEDSVNYYLDKCKKDGLSPNKAFSGTFNVRVGKDLHKSAAIAATKAGISLNDFVRDCVSSCLLERATVNVVENHTHYHSTGLVETDNYDEDSSSLWTQKIQNDQKPKEFH